MKIIDIHARNNFTLLRLTLATLVVFGHFTTLPGTGLTSWIYGYADTAVQGFFIVSGYLIAASWEKNPHWIDFFIKRLFRIYPLYLTVIVIQTIVMVALLPTGQAVPDNIAHYFVLNAAFLNFLQHDIGGLFRSNPVEGINPSLWTLKIEVGFYIVLPFIWILFRRFGWGVLALIFVISTALFELMILRGHFNLAKQLPCQLRYFAIAIGIALYAYRNAFRIKPLVAAPLAIILLVLYSNLELWWQDLCAPMLVGGMVFLFATCLPSVRLKRDISFGVYLFHAPLIQLSLLLGYFHSQWWFLTGLISIVYLLAIAAERLIELPGIALGRRLLDRFDPGASDPLVH